MLKAAMETVEGLEEELDYSKKILLNCGASSNTIDIIQNRWFDAKGGLINTFGSMKLLSEPIENETETTEDNDSNITQEFNNWADQTIGSRYTFYDSETTLYNNPVVNKRMFKLLHELNFPYNNYFPCNSITFNSFITVLRMDYPYMNRDTSSGRYFLLREYLKDIFKLADENFKINGIKFNKFFIETFPYLDKAYIDWFNLEWSKFTQSLKTKDATVAISFKLSDFLLMSMGGNWTTCMRISDYHYAERKGEYSGGILSYALDNVTGIAYKPRDMYFDAVGVKVQDKTWRMIFHVDLDNCAAVFGRHYPSFQSSYSRAVRYLVMSYLSRLAGVSNNWIRCNGCAACNMDEHSIAYDDTSECDEVTNTRLKDTNLYADVEYGAPSLCFKCGTQNYNNEDVFCNDCSCREMCDYCEEYYDEDDLTTLDNGNHVCRRCRDEYCFTCDSCGRYYDEQCIHETNTERNLCPSCWEECYTCMICNGTDMSRDGHVDREGTFVCDNCMEDDDADFCSECKRLFPIDDLSENLLCSICEEEKENEEEEEDNEEVETCTTDTDPFPF